MNFSQFATRAVIPLMPFMVAPIPLRDLNPIFVIAGAPYVLLTQAIARIPVQKLECATESLAEHRDEVTRALDILFIGVRSLPDGHAANTWGQSDIACASPIP